MKNTILPTVVLFLSLLNIQAQTYHSTGLSNDWKDPAAWTCQGGGCKDFPDAKMNGGVKVYLSDSMSINEEIQLINGQLILEEGGVLHLVNAGLDVENNKNKGSLISSFGKIRIDLDWNNRGIVELENSQVYVGGAAVNEKTIVLDSTCLFIDGSLVNSGSIDQEGFIEIGGNVDNTGTWAIDVPYCLDGSLSGSIPAAEDCDAGAFCQCLLEPCVIPNPDIEPGVNSVLKVDSVVGPFLTALNEGLTQDGLKEDVLVVAPNGQDVCVDIFVLNYSAVVSLLNNTYGITTFQPGSNNLVITVFFPIADLDELNKRSDIIRFVRATPVGRTNANSTLPNQGDYAQESFFARAGFDLSGQGVKIGVLSDSYNKSGVFGNQTAQADVAGGVLPGDVSVGAQNPNPVQVLLDYPGDGSDEGRGMLQIVHSVAPQAELFFHTAFISPSSFADGIRALRNAQCDLIVDDVTYITESFYGRGLVAKAVEEVVSQSGVDYLTSAGNFDDRAFEGVFSTTAGNKHNFQSGDYLQGLVLEPGDYLLVLQWDDKIFSIGESGAEVDLDVYLADQNGNKIYGFNDNSLGKDPVEIMPFSVVSATATTSNLLIENGGPTNADGMPFKYVVFRAGGSMQSGFSAEYFQGGSTVVGHANNAAAMSVGAVRYYDTPSFGGTLKTEWFSSMGAGSKPDFTAPDGGNVTINLGNDISEDLDNLPNFFGTSAAAPHAAGICALLLEAQSKFGVSFDLRQKLISTAINYGEPSSKMGAGFITAFDAMESFANPNPSISKLDLSLLGSDPSSGGTIVIEGSFFNDETQVFIRDVELEILEGSTDSTLLVDIPPFLGNPPIWIYNAPLANGDGGADTAYVTDPVITEVMISTNTLVKKYGEAIPTLSFTTDNADLNGNASLFALLESAVTLSTTASDTSSVGDYAILASWNDATLDPALQELYSFSVGVVGFLTIEPLAMTIKPKPITAVYGEALPPILFDYTFEPGVNVVNAADLVSQIESDHQSSIAPDLAVLTNLSLVNLSLVNLSLVNKAFLASLRSTLPNLSLANLSLANGMDIIEVDARLFEETPTNNLENGTDFIGNLSLVNFLSLANNTAYQNGNTTGDPELNLSLANLSLVNLSLANYSDIENINNLSLVNLSLANFLSLANLSLVNLSLVNGTSVEDFSLPMRNFLSLANNDNTGMVTILSPADINAPSSESVPLVPVNFVTGLDAGPQKIAPAAFLSRRSSKNLIVSYEEGDLTITPANLIISVEDTSITYGDQLPEFVVNAQDLLLGDSLPEVVSGVTVAYPGDAGNYDVSPVLVPNGNYNVSTISGSLTVEKADLMVSTDDTTRLYGQDNPEFAVNYSGFVFGDTQGQLATPASATSAATCSSDVGSYDIVVAGGVDNNYNFISTNGTLTIEPSVMTITALDVLVNDGDVPVFVFETSTDFCGSNVVQQIQDPSLIDGELDQPLAGPGTYVITPIIVNFDASNHVLQLIDGTLFVNTVVGCHDKIRASDICQESVLETVDGVTYTTRLHFEYSNPLATPFYIPLGADNLLNAKGGAIFLGDPPTVFEPGVHTFSVLTDGGSVQWEIKSPGCNNADKSANGSNADPCSGTASVARMNTPESVTPYEVTVYPNPFQDRINVVSKIHDDGLSKLRVFGNDGSIIRDIRGLDLRGGYEVNLTQVPAGIYYIQVISGRESWLTKIVKM